MYMYQVMGNINEWLWINQDFESIHIDILLYRTLSTKNLPKLNHKTNLTNFLGGVTIAAFFPPLLELVFLIDLLGAGFLFTSFFTI